MNRLATALRSERVECFLEAIGVRALGLGQGLEPVGDFLKSFLSCRLGHSGVHVGVLVGLTGNGGLEVLGRLTDRQARSGVANLLQILEVPVRVPRLALGGGAKYGRDVVEAFNVGLGCEVQVAAI